MSDPTLPLSGLHLSDDQHAAQNGQARRPVLDETDLLDDALRQQQQQQQQPRVASGGLDAQHNGQDPNFLTVTASFRRGGAVLPTLAGPTLQSEASVITDLGNRLRRRTDSSALTCDENPGDLQDALFNEFVRSEAQGADFLPNRQLPRLINPASVEKELDVHQRSFIKRIKTLNFRLPLSKAELAVEARRICGSGEQSWRSHPETVVGTRTVRRYRPLGDKSYRKILAILILIDRPSRIRDFVDEEVCDADLPLERFSPPGKGSLHWELRKRGGKAPLKCFNKKRKWRQSTLRRFEDAQWIVLAPFLGQDSRKLALRFKIPDSAILPFTKWDKIPCSGGYSKVFRAAIHPDHHAFETRPSRDDPRGDEDLLSPIEPRTTRDSSKPRKESILVAVKQLCPQTTEQEFLREFDILRRISKYNHKHLITLLASYEHRELYHFIFPWAEKDLLGYWKEFTPEKGPEAARWIAEQFEGLASGLEAVHKHDTFSGDSLMNNFGSPRATRNSLVSSGQDGTRALRTIHCRHGDIKPENVLWFADASGRGRGMLKITDFGTAELTDKDEAPWKKNPTSLFYEPPEATIPPAGGIIKTSYDIWCLGCVFLNMIVWYFDGWDGIEQFESDRLDVDFLLHDVPFRTPKFYFEEKNSRGILAARVKTVVYQVIQDLQSRLDCTPFFREILDLIRKGMLVVEQEGQGRKSAHNIASEIGEMLDKGVDHFSVPEL